MKIAIDAGHGMNTAGKRTPDGKMREFEFNNKVAKYLAEELNKYKDVSILFTYDTSGKVDTPLKTRVDTADNEKANFFVSIHANASSDSWSTANGIETFVYTKKEQGALKAATLVQKELISSTGLRDRGVKEGDFAVVRDTDMDAILVECGFMNNKKEAALLMSDAYRKKCALAIAKGIVAHLKLVLKQPTPVQKPPVNDTLYIVSVGAYKDKGNADDVVKQLKNKGFGAYIHICK